MSLLGEESGLTILFKKLWRIELDFMGCYLYESWVCLALKPEIHLCFQLGRFDLAILIDCTEQFCIESIRKRREEGMEVRPGRNNVITIV